jgi:hypothetical protein
MSPLLPLLLVVSASTPGPCYVPADQSPGWKQVALPENAPQLAAPAGIDQFRPAEPAQVTESNPDAYRGAHEPRPGRLVLSFAVPADARRLELELVEPLRGAKVDAEVFTGTRSLPLFDERRVPGKALVLDWDIPEVRTVTVTVHHHFRDRPIVHRWRVVRSAVLADDVTLSASFKLGRSLYYRQPPGRRLELCQAPGQRLELDRSTLDSAATPSSVSLAPK